MRKLMGKRVAIVVCTGFEQVELTEPRAALEDEGGIADIVSPERKWVWSWKGNGWGKHFRIDVPMDEANPARYDALVLPGGVMNADRLRLYPKAIAFIRSFVDAGKPIAAIGHAPWALIDAGLEKGLTMTSWPTLQADLRNAGAAWVDEEVVRDGRLVTSRMPADIPAYNRKMMELVQECAGTEAQGE
jgi:protease I